MVNILVVFQDPRTAGSSDGGNIYFNIKIYQNNFIFKEGGNTFFFQVEGGNTYFNNIFSVMIKKMLRNC